jgi:hypothetical protein
MTRAKVAALVVLMAQGLGACSPTVKVEAPTEPITINLNVKIEHEIRVKVDKQLDDLIAQEDDIF